MHTGKLDPKKPLGRSDTDTSKGKKEKERGKHITGDDRRIVDSSLDKNK